MAAARPTSWQRGADAMARPVVLAVGGLDPSAGAGIGADLRAIGSVGAWGCVACTALTVQSTRGLCSVYPVGTALLAAQIAELLADLPVAVVKIGAVGSAANARWLARHVGGDGRRPLVVDPVLLPSRARVAGAPLSGRGSLAALRELARAATVLTPNVPEAEALLGNRICSEDQARAAAVTLCEGGPRAVLLKGGHARWRSGRVSGAGCCVAGSTVRDWLATRDGVWPLDHAAVVGAEVHGTGCTLASLLAARLACRRFRDGWVHAPPSDAALAAAARWAVSRLQRLRRGAVRLGKGMAVLPDDPQRSGARPRKPL